MLLGWAVPSWSYNVCQVSLQVCSGCPKRCLGTGRKEWCLLVLQMIPGVWLRAAWLCLLHVLTVTPCRCLRSWTRSGGRWQKKPKMEAFQSTTEKETSANALTMQTNWVGGGKERAAVGVWHRTGSANSAFSVLQARQALAAPSTLLWAWPSSPWCSWCWQPAWPWQWELQPGTSCDRHSVALLGGKGRDVPCLFSDLSLAGGELAAEWE